MLIKKSLPSSTTNIANKKHICLYRDLNPAFLLKMKGYKPLDYPPKRKIQSRTSLSYSSVLICRFAIIVPVQVNSKSSLARESE